MRPMCSNFQVRSEFALCIFFLVRRCWLMVCCSSILCVAQQNVPRADSAASPQETASTSDFAHARAELQTLEASSPRPTGLDLEIGSAYYKKSDYPKAIEYFTKAAAADPKSAESQQLLGLSYYLGGHPAQAIPLLEKVQTWFPRANVDASYILGICYIQTKNYPQARKAFAKMFGVPADSAASYLFTARMLLRQEFDPIAAEYAQKAVSLDSRLPLAHFLLGELFL